MLKLIAIDMDGTLLNEAKKIPKENIEAIRQAAEKGIKVVICTGRMQSGVMPYFEQLDFAGQDEYAILNNGCSIHHTSDWSLYAYKGLTQEDIEVLAKASENYSDIHLTFTDRLAYTVLDDTVPDIVAYDSGLVFTTAQPVTLQTALANAPVFQAMYLGEETAMDKFQKDQEELLAQRFSTVRSQSYIFEAMPQGVTKATALAQLAEELGYLPEEVMAIGDGNNDLEMLRYAGVSVAMGNGTAEVKAEARFETGHCDDAGVAQAIRKYALLKSEVPTS